MGREAVCTCDWAGTVAEVKALLETGEIILRGEIRRRVPFSEIRDARVQADCLCFTVGREAVQLVLGASAAKWAEVITSPPPSLARKLGITKHTMGKIEDENLKTALAEAACISAKGADLIVACVDTPESMEKTFRQAEPALLRGVPIWVVYAKGRGQALNETAIRSFLRDNGMMDTKVASVSASLTALRFSKRKSD
jgi:DNA-binding XRE family transcriptional regulator